MLKLKKVLVVVDPEQESQPALDKVLVLAHREDFEILLLACDYTDYLVEGYYFDAVDLVRLREEYLAERKVVLEALAEPLRQQGLIVDTQTVWGHPGYKAIVMAAIAAGVDLVVRHTRQHSALSRLFLSNDDWQLIRCCPMPLLLVKEKPWQATPVFLAAVDPKHARHKPQGLDHKILHVAIDLAQSMQGVVHVVHSYSQIPLSGSYLKQAKLEHKQALAELVSEFDLPVAQIHLLEEAPEFGLKKLEKDLGADMVVMGAISRSIISEVFIGSTTEKVIDYLLSDALIIKPDDFASPLIENSAS
ncbi:universal stress protein [Pseudomonadales bacterium]|nr:universal stress protein [Pseudomonadales bacterium]MDB4068736.1 universal stress protein [Pseudomonadales bacterium]MDB4151777.1 universal stress protein [Pseudomonadales bacterium]